MSDSTLTVVMLWVFILGSIGYLLYDRIVLSKRRKEKMRKSTFRVARDVKKALVQAQQDRKTDPELDAACSKVEHAIGNFFSGKLEEFNHKTNFERAKRTSELIEMERLVEEQKAKLRLYKEMDHKNVSDTEAMLLTLFNPKKASSSSSTKIGFEGMTVDNSTAAEYGSPESIMQIKQQKKMLDALLNEKLVELEEKQVKIRQAIAQARQAEAQADLDEHTKNETLRGH